MVKNMVEAKAMNWPQGKAFNKFRRELVAKSENSEVIGEESVDWVLEHVYPDVKAEEITMAEALELFKKTMELTNQLKDDEEKN